MGFWVGLYAWDFPTERQYSPGPPLNYRAELGNFTHAFTSQPAVNQIESQ